MRPIDRIALFLLRALARARDEAGDVAPAVDPFDELLIELPAAPNARPARRARTPRAGKARPSTSAARIEGGGSS